MKTGPMMDTRRAIEADLDPWVGLRHALWVDSDRGELLEEARSILESEDEECFLLTHPTKGVVGFVEATVHSSPDGPYCHVEGWYVSPEFRRIGHGKDLMDCVEQWSLHRAIYLLTSDTEADYPLSPGAHTKAGFKKIHELMIFAKELEEPPERIGSSRAHIALLSAFGKEGHELKRRLTNAQTEQILGTTVLSGVLEKCPVVLAQVGIGPVNASMTTAALLQHYTPSAVIFSGIAGGLNPQLHVGDVVIGRDFFLCECGEEGPDGFELTGSWNPVTDAQNPIYFQADPELLAHAENTQQSAYLKSVRRDDTRVTPTIMRGRVATGEKFIRSTAYKRMLHETYGADVINCECAAIAQVCFQQRIPMIGILSISDLAGDELDEEGELGYDTAAENADNTTTGLVRSLSRVPS